MAIYTVRDKNTGKTYKIRGPENASDFQIKQYLQSQLAAEKDDDDDDVIRSDAPTGLGGVYNAARQGLSDLAGVPDVVAAEELSRIADYEQDRAERDARGELPLWERILTAQLNREDPEQLRAQAADAAKRRADRYDRSRAAFPLSEAGSAQIQDISESGFLEGLSKVARKPLATGLGVLEVAAQQTPSILAAAGATALTRSPTLGAAVMAGSTYTQERYGQLLNDAAEAGYDLRDPAQAQAAVQDKSFMDAQAEKGRTRGLIIGTVDLLTAGLASKTPLTLAGVGKNTGIQAVGGGTGEAAAQVASGEEIQGGEVLIEALAEGVTAPVDVAALGLRTKGKFRERPTSSLTDLQPELAQQLAEEEAQLQAQALAEEQKQQKQVEALDDAVYEVRAEAAKTFTPEEKFMAERKKARDTQNKAAVADPQTELGAAFKNFLKAQREAGKAPIYGGKKLEAAQKEFLKGYDKDNQERYDAEDLAAYEQALDLHAQQLADGTITPEVKTELKAPAAATSEPVQETAPAPAAVDPLTIPIRQRKDAIRQVEALVEDGSLPPNWAEQNDDLNGAINGERFQIKPYKEALDKVLNPVDKTTTEAEPEAVPETAEEIRRTPFSNDLEFRSTLSPQRQQVYDAIIKSAENNTLGDIFYVEFESGTEATAEPELSMAPEAVKARQTKQRKILKAGGVKEETLVKVFKKITKPLSPADQKEFKKKSSSQPLRQYQQVKILEDAGVSEDLITKFKNAATTPSKSKAATERGFNVKTVNSVLKSRSGIENEQSAGTQASKVITAMREYYGNDLLREALAQAGVTVESGIGVADAQMSTDLVSEGGMRLSTIDTAGGSQVEGASETQSRARKASDVKRFKDAGMTDEQITAFYNPQREADTVEAELAGQVLEDVENARYAVENADRLLRAQWAASSVEGGPSYDDLSMNNKIDWMETVYATLGQANQSEVLAERANALGGITDATAQDNESGRTEVQEPSREETGAQLPEDTGRRTEADAKPAEGDGQSFTAGQQKTPVVTIKKGSKLKGKKFSKGPNTGTPSKFEAVEARIKFYADKLFGIREVTDSRGRPVDVLRAGSANSRIQVHRTPEAAVRQLGGSMTLEEVQDAKAFIDPRDNSTAHFIASNISENEVEGVVLHEVGVHLGLEAQLAPDQVTSLANVVRDWQNAPEGSVENDVFKRATARVAFARATGMDSSLVDIEFLAYAVEEAVNAGVTLDPNVEAIDATAKVRQWLSDVRDFFQKLLQRWTSRNIAENETGERSYEVLSADDLVALARGAGYLANTGTVEVGALTDSARELIGFYTGEDRGRKVSDDANIQFAPDYFGQEEFSWGADSQYGPYKNITTDAAFRVINTSDAGEVIQMSMMVYSEDVDDGTTPITSLNLSEVDPNLFSLTVFGPENEDISNISDVKDLDGDEWTRLEGVTHSQNMRLFTEARRRITRFTGGLVPSIVYSRVTGAAASSGQARTEGMPSFEVRKRFSKNMPPVEETENQISWVRKNLGTGAAEALTNLSKISRQPFDATKNLDRLVRENEAKMPSARKWFDFMLAAEATKNEVLSLVESVMNQARPLSMERKELVNDFLGSSTFYQKWGYDPQWVDRKTGEPIEVEIDPTMKKKYDRLTDEEKQLVRDVFAHGRTMQELMQDVAEKLGVSKFFKFDSGLKGPYAPLKRFGNQVAELKSQELLDAEAAQERSPSAENRKAVEKLKSDGDHYVVSFFDSPGAAETFVLANKDKYAYAEYSEKAISYEDSRTGGARAYEKILGAVNANLAGLDQDSKNAMAKLVRDMYFQTLDDSNARLSGTKRLNRAGYDKNMLRSFAVHGMAQANLIAQMKHGADTSAALVDAYKEAKKTPRTLLPVYNKIALKFQRTMTPRTGLMADIETNVMKFNSFYMLTSSLGYFFQNMTQPIYAVSNIAGEFGLKQAQTWGKLFSGYGVAKKVINTSFLNQIKNVASMGLLGGNSTVELDIDQAPPELRPLLKDLQMRGLLDVGIAEDLRHVNMSENIAVRAYDEMTHRLYQSARYVEASNRIASAVAAFKMAQQNPKHLKLLKMTPKEYALRIVQDTQGNFSQLDAPALFDATPLRTPFQFRKYQFQMAWLYFDAAKQAFKGANPALKMAGFRKFSLMMGYTGIFGGLVAVPMSNVASALLQAAIAGLSGDDEENPPRDLERWIRENVEDERTATLLVRGVPAALGWDFSQKLDQSDIFMPYNSKYVDLNPDADSALLFTAQMLLGPTGTTVRNMGNIADFINRGNYYRAAEYAMPKGLRSYLETLRLADEGYTTRGELTITDPTKFDAVDFLTNAIGLPSTDINQIKWTRGQQIEIQQWFSDQTSRIKRGYLSAYDDRDREAMAEYRDEFRELQKAKDRVRPFFNNSRNVLKRASVSDLIKAPRARAREQRRLDSVTGN